MRAVLASLVLAIGACSSSPPPSVGPALRMDAGIEPFDDSTCTPATARGPLEVVTEQGTLRGTVDEGVRAFLGVPFAAPPVGQLRWRAPQPPACWNNVRDASRYGEACTQMSGDKVVGSEDCLTLNVWSPTASADANLPVMVWIHGGDNIIGSAQDDFAGEPVYAGMRLARRAGVVVVVVQYRLGAFGFLDHEALDTDGIHGNFGTLDQIAALDWVQRNIAAFGGDPTRVTIFGQSAGGDAVCALVASPRAKGLFSGAIFHSGACHVSSPEARSLTAQTTLRTLGCDTGDCLRSKSTEEVARVPGGGLSGQGTDPADFYITVDGTVLPQSPMELIANGESNHVPIVVMATRDEYLSLVDLVVRRPLKTQDDFDAYVRESFTGATADFVIENYPLASFASPSHAFVAALSDSIYHCPNRRLLRALSRWQYNKPVYRAIFASVYDDKRIARYGAGHGMDVPYVFDTFGALDLSLGERTLSDRMIEAWGKFAAGGELATASLPFREYDPTNDSYLELDDVVSNKAAFHKTLCDAWDKLE